MNEQYKNYYKKRLIELREIDLDIIKLEKRLSRLQKKKAKLSKTVEYYSWLSHATSNHKMLKRTLLLNQDINNLSYEWILGKNSNEISNILDEYNESSS